MEYLWDHAEDERRVVGGLQTGGVPRGGEAGDMELEAEEEERDEEQQSSEAGEPPAAYYRHPDPHHRPHNSSTSMSDISWSAQSVAMAIADPSPHAQLITISSFF